MTWMCSICGYTYDGEDFTKEADDYLCPLCDSGKENFQQRDLATEIQSVFCRSGRGIEAFRNYEKDVRPCKQENDILFLIISYLIDIRFPLLFLYPSHIALYRPVFCFLKYIQLV